MIDWNVISSTKFYQGFNLIFFYEHLLKKANNGKFNF